MRLLSLVLALALASCRTPATPPSPPAADSAIDDLGAELQRLRAIPGHFGGGAWHDDVDRYGGRKHVLLQQLGQRLATATRARIEAVMGAPDAIAHVGDPLWQLAAPTASGATLLVYHWRGTHDFLYFELTGATSTRSGWWMALE